MPNKCLANVKQFINKNKVEVMEMCRVKPQVIWLIVASFLCVSMQIGEQLCSKYIVITF